MNLLLLLSALLSALTGVVGGGQRLEAAPAVACSIGGAACRATALVATSRPLAGLPPLVATALAVVPIRLVSGKTIPLWANRRRE